MSSMISYSTTTADPATIMMMLAVFTIPFVAIYAAYAFILGRMFKKAGINPGIAWVPIYNVWKFYEMGDQEGYWAILACVPFINIVSVVMMIIAANNINRKFNKPSEYIWLAIFLMPIWMIILAFDDSRWNDNTNAITAPNNGQNNYAPPMPMQPVTQFSSPQPTGPIMQPVTAPTQPQPQPQPQPPVSFAPQVDNINPIQPVAASPVQPEVQAPTTDTPPINNLNQQ